MSGLSYAAGGAAWGGAYVEEVTLMRSDSGRTVGGDKGRPLMSCAVMLSLCFVFYLFIFNPRTQEATHVKLEESPVTHSDSLLFLPCECFNPETHPLVLALCKHVLFVNANFSLANCFQAGVAKVYTLDLFEGIV